MSGLRRDEFTWRYKIIITNQSNHPYQLVRLIFY
ncbi:MAG: ApaG domain [Bacteroidetes bacterium]|nr:ApaG domain [Bacteroidota bacterium]